MQIGCELAAWMLTSGEVIKVPTHNCTIHIAHAGLVHLQQHSSSSMHACSNSIYFPQIRKPSPYLSITLTWGKQLCSSRDQTSSSKQTRICNRQSYRHPSMSSSRTRKGESGCHLKARLCSMPWSVCLSVTEFRTPVEARFEVKCPSCPKMLPAWHHAGTCDLRPSPIILISLY